MDEKREQLRKLEIWESIIQRNSKKIEIKKSKRKNCSSRHKKIQKS